MPSRALMLRSVGRLSDGVRLGWRVGFDSGAMMDYVYRNRAAGITPLGRAIDRLYLNSVGWRGIPHPQGAPGGDAGPCHGLGPGRRAAGACGGHRRRPWSAMCWMPWTGGVSRAPRRCCAISVATMSPPVRPWPARSACATSPSSRATPSMAMPCADCRRGRASLSPAGLYELFPGNDRVRVSLMGLGAAVEEGRLPDLHQPALASPARVHRPGADQLPRRPALGHAPPQPGRDGPAGRRRRL